MDVGPTSERSTWLRAVAVTAGLGVVGLGSVAWLAAGEPDSPDRVEPTEPVEQPLVVADVDFERIVGDPQVDIGYLAGVHAASRQNYDECQQDFADLTDELSSSRHPLYFC